MADTKSYMLVNPNNIFRVPLDVEKCPICGGQILLEFDEYEQDSDGLWLPTDCGLHSNCESEPDIDGNLWEDWLSGHWSMPYVDWLPVETRLLKWFNAHYRLDLTTPIAVHEIVAQPLEAPVEQQPVSVPDILADNLLAPDMITLARLLKWANSNPEGWFRKQFYTIKDAILHTYAKRNGFDIQHIQKKCWDCNGKGFIEEYHTADDWDGHDCYRCGGTGIYSEFYVLLQRWSLGDRIFHIPDRHITKTEAEQFKQDKADFEGYFEGYFEHSDIPPTLRRLAYLTLAYIFFQPFYYQALEYIAEDNSMIPLFGYGSVDADCKYVDDARL